ncbi:MAG: hypothetical protein IT204_17075 [Fimbriimonadaceae bacterium]|nr:hypothetical protein [Fimbriimonadaceae bacterium]
MRLCALLLLLPASAAVNVGLTVQNPSGLPATAWPVTTGVPFAPGVLRDAAQLRLVDAAGREVPAQIVCNSRHFDGSVRWVLLDCQLDLPAAGRALRLEVGPGVSRQEPTGIRVTPGPDTLAVDTGALQVTFDRRRGGVWSSLRRGGAELLSPAAAGAYFVSDVGERFAAAADAQATVEVELAGPLRTVVTTRAWFVNAAGRREGQVIARHHFHAGQSTVRLALTWVQTADSRQLRFRDLGWRLPLPSREARFVLADGQSLSLPSGPQAGLVQEDWDRYRLLTGTAPPTAQPLGLVLASGPAALCGLTVRDFRQQFPKELSVAPDGLTFHLWPAHGRAKPGRRVDDANLQYLWFAHEGELLDFQPPAAFVNHQQGLSDNDYRYLRSSANANAMGLAKTFDLLLTFAPPAAAPDAAIREARLFQDPPAALADPAWLCDSGVFGQLQPADAARFGQYETLIRDNFDAERRLEAFTRDYGMWNWGDSHTSWNTATRRWSDAYRCWRNTHHGAPRVPWLLYIRSGEVRYLRYAQRNTRHVLDLDFCHYSTPEFEALEYPQGKLKGALNDYKGIVHWHSGNRLMDYNSMTDFALWYYHLTGDRWGLEVATDWGEAVEAKFTQPFGSRSGTGTMSALIDLYTETHDEGYRPIIEAFFTHLTTKVQNHGQDVKYSDHVLSYWPQYKDQVIPVGAFPEWENYAPWIERYWDLTHSEPAKRALLAWADAYLAGFGDMTSLWGTKEYLNVLGYAYLVTRDPKYLGRGVWELDRVAASVNRDDELLRGLIMTGQVSLSGYVIQRLPTFLKALAVHGQPVAPDPLLASSPGFQLLFERTRPTIDGQATKIETTAWLLWEATDQPFTIRAGTSHTYPERTYLFRVLGPDGGELHRETARVPQGEREFSQRVPADGRTGVYRCELGGEGSFGRVMAPVRSEPELPVAYPLANRLLPCEGARYWCWVPPGARQVRLHLAPVNGGAVTLQATSPDGQTRRSASSVAGEAETVLTILPTAPGGQCWELILAGSPAAVRLTADGAAVPQMLYGGAYPPAVCAALGEGR